MTRSPREASAPVRGLRFNHREGFFELKCSSCPRDGSGVWWPLSLEYWNPHYGYSRCRSCASKVQNLRMRESRARRRETIRAKNRKYYQDNADILRMKQALRDEARWDEKKAYNRKHYWENRERILAQRKRKRDEARLMRQLEASAHAA